MFALKTIKSRYTITFIGFVLLVMLLTMLGIKRLVAPQLMAAGESIVLSQVSEIGEQIAMELARVEAQARSITQLFPCWKAMRLTEFFQAWSINTVT